MTERIVKYVNGDENLDSIARYFIDKQIHPSEVTYDSYSRRFSANRRESDQSFSNRVAKYEKKMQAYHNWYEENRQLIEEELNRRKSLIKESKVRDEEKLLKRLEREKQTVAKRLARIEKQLKNMK